MLQGPRLFRDLLVQPASQPARLILDTGDLDAYHMWKQQGGLASAKYSVGQVPSLPKYLGTLTLLHVYTVV